MYFCKALSIFHNQVEYRKKWKGEIPYEKTDICITCRHALHVPRRGFGLGTSDASERSDAGSNDAAACSGSEETGTEAAPAPKPAPAPHHSEHDEPAPAPVPYYH